MSAGKWNPGHFVRIRINRFFDDRPETGEFASGPCGSWAPAVDVYETSEEYVIEAELPDVREEDIDLVVEGDTITVQGERRVRGRRLESYYQVERACGAFRRSFRFPLRIEPESVRAIQKDGILTVRIPKAVPETLFVVRVE